MENPEPLFVARGVRMEREPRAVQERHLRVMLEDTEDGAKLGGMAWARRVNWAERAKKEGWAQGAMVDVAFRLRENRHPDFGGIEMEVVALRGARGGDEVPR
jgi:single-stranded-DNA-specific exonuclease